MTAAAVCSFDFSLDDECERSFEGESNANERCYWSNLHLDGAEHWRKWFYSRLEEIKAEWDSLEFHKESMTN